MHHPPTSTPQTDRARLADLADRLHTLSFRGHVADPKAACPECAEACEISREIVSMRRSLTESELFRAFGVES